MSRWVLRSTFRSREPQSALSQLIEFHSIQGVPRISRPPSDHANGIMNGSNMRRLIATPLLTSPRPAQRNLHQCQPARKDFVRCNYTFNAALIARSTVFSSGLCQPSFGLGTSTWRSGSRLRGRNRFQVRRLQVLRALQPRAAPVDAAGLSGRVGDGCQRMPPSGCSYRQAQPPPRYAHPDSAEAEAAFCCRWAGQSAPGERFAIAALCLISSA
jgi:hypothetical protein